MKTLIPKLAVLLLCLAGAPSAFAAVGYINLSIYPGDNLVANQLLNGDNSLNASFTDGVPHGATFTKWNSLVNQFLPASTFNASSMTWSINYSFNLGEGGLLQSSSSGTVTVVGTVPNYPPVGGTPWQPNYADGFHLISAPVPYSAPMDVLFPHVVGRAPDDGEWVNILDAATQTYTITTFHADTDSWDNGNPPLAVGESAWFNLGPVAVPEPAVLLLAGLGASAMLVFRRRKSRLQPGQTVALIQA